VTEKETPKKVTRRDFIRDAAVLGGAVTGAGVLAGCGPEAPAATPEVITETVEVTKVVEKVVEKEVPVEVIKEVPVEVALQEAIGHIVIDPELCAGCSICMAVCSLSHNGAVSPELSGIQVMCFPREGAVVNSNVCQHCKGPECLYACPTGAIYIDEATGARVIDPEKCIGCRLCQEACPNKKSDPHYYGDGLSPIRYDAENNVCFKCDLCGGDPLCVKYCPFGALRASWIVAAVPFEGEIEIKLSGTAVDIVGGVSAPEPTVSVTPTGLVVDGVVKGGSGLHDWEAKIQAEVYDAAGTVLFTSEQVTGRGYYSTTPVPYKIEFATPEPAKVKKVILTITAEQV
jgi:carbon-monoxide dehydrogenase iron sulfur subunit